MVSIFKVNLSYENKINIGNQLNKRMSNIHAIIFYRYIVVSKESKIKEILLLGDRHFADFTSRGH